MEKEEENQTKQRTIHISDKYWDSLSDIARELSNGISESKSIAIRELIKLYEKNKCSPSNSEKQ